MPVPPKLDNLLWYMNGKCREKPSLKNSRLLSSMLSGSSTAGDDARVPRSGSGLGLAWYFAAKFCAFLDPVQLGHRRSPIDGDVASRMQNARPFHQMVRPGLYQSSNSTDLAILAPSFLSMKGPVCPEISIRFSKCTCTSIISVDGEHMIVRRHHFSTSWNRSAPL